MLPRLASLALSVPVLLAGLPGCVFEGGHGAAVCATATAMPIDTGASITHAAGIDAGYYAQYTAGGHWHVEWTCDTKLSATGCNFTGSITVDTPAGAGGANPACFQCESEDLLDATTAGNQTRLDFNTLTSSGIDGVDIDGLPGHPMQLTLQIDGLDRNDLVFVPSLGRTAVPACMPLELTPTAP